LSWMSCGHPTPTTWQASGGGPPPQTSTLIGTTSHSTLSRNCSGARRGCHRGSPECRRLPHHSKATQPSQRQLTGSPPLCLSTTDHRRPAGITLRRHGHENVQVRRGSEWIRFDGTWRVARGSTSLGHLPRTRTSRPQGQTISVAHHRRLADDPGPPRCL
jgi:hypothetical protein